MKTEYTLALERIEGRMLEANEILKKSLELLERLQKQEEDDEDSKD